MCLFVTVNLYIFLLLGYGMQSSHTCVPVPYKIGNHYYRKFFIFKSKFKGNMYNYDNRAGYGISEGKVHVFPIRNPTKVQQMVFQKLSSEEYTDIDLDVKFIFNREKKKNPLLMTKDTIYQMNIRLDLMTKVEVIDFIPENWKSRLNKYLPMSSWMTFSDIHQRYTLHDDKNNLVVVDISTDVKYTKRILMMALDEPQYYIFNGYIFDSYLTENIGPAVKLFQLPTNVTPHSIVIDYEKNVFLCHSAGITMVNPYFQSGEQMANFTDCNAMLFSNRHVFLDNSLGFSKFSRVPDPHPLPNSVTFGTTSSSSTTTQKAVTDKEHSTQDYHYTGTMVHENEDFYINTEAVSDQVVIAIVIGFAFAAVLLVGCIIFYGISMASKHIQGPFSVGIRT